MHAVFSNVHGGLPQIIQAVETFFSFRDAGEADLTARLINTDRNEEVPIKLTDNRDGTYTVQYKPAHVGSHSLSLCYGGVEVPGSPKFKVIPNIDVSQIRVEGLESSK